jgi:16S rRNA (cytidine1402-2'-O)-methyltransferase
MALTLVFYESPKRLNYMLTSLRDILGEDRNAAVCRELTKKFEEVRRGTLGTLVDDFADRRVKGEVVVLVARGNGEVVGEMDVQTALADAMQTMRVKDAATMVAGAMGLPRRQVYQMALGLEKETE